MSSELFERLHDSIPPLGKNIAYYYRDLSAWIVALTHRRPTNKPLFIALNGPQGSGKTTLTTKIVKSAKEAGLRAVGISIDDFYLDRQTQQQLADTHPDQPCWQQRGYPGTHAIDLGESTISNLLRGQPTLIPKYDKSAFDGLGDRLPRKDWLPCSTRTDLLILEGWMLGFQQNVPCPHSLKRPNEKLSEYDSWITPADLFICLWTKYSEHIVEWRIEAEKNMRRQCGEGMSDQAAESYIRKFLPAYRQWGFGHERWPQHVPQLRLELDAQRNLQSLKPHLGGEA